MILILICRGKNHVIILMLILKLRAYIQFCGGEWHGDWRRTRRPQIPWSSTHPASSTNSAILITLTPQLNWIVKEFRARERERETWERGLTANSGMERNSSEGMKPQLLRSSWQKRWYRETISCCVTRHARAEIKERRMKEENSKREMKLGYLQAFLQCCWTSSMSYWVSMEDVLPMASSSYSDWLSDTKTTRALHCHSPTAQQLSTTA